MLILDVVGPATLQGCADKLNTVYQQGVCLHRCLNLCNFVIMTKCSIEVPLFYIYQRIVCRVLEIFFPMSVIWTFYPNIFNKNMKKLHVYLNFIIINYFQLTLSKQAFNFSHFYRNWSNFSLLNQVYRMRSDLFSDYTEGFHLISVAFVRNLVIFSQVTLYISTGHLD